MKWYFWLLEKLYGNGKEVTDEWLNKLSNLFFFVIGVCIGYIISSL